MKYIILVIALFAGFLGWSQQLTFIFKGTVENQDVGKNEAGVTVSVVQNGGTLFSGTSVSSGKYSIGGPIDYAQPFDVVFSKAGLVSKKIHFDLAKMNPEDIPPGDFRPVESLDIKMFKERPNVDFSFLNSEPVGSFDWNTREMTLRSDQVMANQMAKRITDLLTSAEQNAAQNEIKYNEAIAAADKLYNEKTYEASRDKYEEALMYKPTDKYASDRIVELDALIQAMKKQELQEAQENSEYNNLISAADNLKAQDKLEAAIAKYKEALTKKDEQYPKDQIEVLTETLEKRKKEQENQAKYDEAIKMADGFLKQNSLRAARDKYQEASNLKPSEKYPKDKLAEIDGKLKAEEEKEAIRKKYDEAVAAADQFFIEEKFAEAKARYEEALTYEASSSYVKGRITMCDEKLAAEKAEKERLEKIKQLLATGNQQISKSEWEPAKASFSEVLTLEAGHPEATEKLALIEQKMKEAADQAAIEEKYAKLMKEGADADKAGQLEPALAKYQEAKAVKSTPEVDTKIADLQKRIADMKGAAEKEAQYAKHMSEGESMLSIINDVNAAREEFVKASALFPDRKEPKDKIAQIDKLLADQKSAQEKKAAYDAAIAAADGLFTSEKYQEAKGKYQEASGIDATQKYPKDQLALIDKKLAELAAANEKQAKYNAAITEADKLFGEKNYSSAKTKYQEAIALDGSQTYPKDKVSEIEGLLANQAAEAEKKAKYDAAIKEGDRLFSESKLENAKAKFVEASAIDPGQTYPKDKIAEIDGLMSNQAAAAAKAAEIAALIEQGNKDYAAKNLEEAKGKFQQVLALDAGNKTANDMLAKINSDLAAMKNQAEKDALFAQLKQEGLALADAKSYDQAIQKLNEALSLKSDKEVSDKVAEIKQAQASQAAQQEKEARYTQLMSEAATEEASKDYANAISKYREASTVKPEEAAPKEKIKQLEALMGEAAQQAQIDKEYADFMKKGDDLMKEEKYLDAIKEFNNALAVKPSEREPVEKAEEAARLEQAKKTDVDEQYEKILQVAQTKINEEDFPKAIELLERAIGLKERDERPKQMLAEAKLLKEQKDAYTALMTQGDQLAASKKYEEAKGKYQEALAKRPVASEPPVKIAEMDRLINDQASEAQKEALYKEFMGKGDVAVSTKNYQQALNEYQSALSVKPGDLPASNKIKEVQQILDDIANANKEDIERKNRFNALIKEADILFDATTYLQAKEKYVQALIIDPGSTYAQFRRDECDRLEALIGVEEAKREYQKIITAGDKKFVEQDYLKSKEYFERALTIKHDDPYPKKKLEEIDAILNPVTIQSGELEDLGVPFKGTLEEAMALLEDAEAARKALKTEAVVDRQKLIRDAEVERTAVKTRDHYENSEQIFQYYQGVSVEMSEYDLGRVENNQVLMDAKKELNDAGMDALQTEQRANQEDQIVLNNVIDGVAFDFGQRDEVHMENADQLKQYNTALMDGIQQDARTDYSENLSSDQHLSDIEAQVSQDMIDDFAERALVELDVVAARDYAVRDFESRNAARYQDQLANKQRVNDVVEAVYTEVVIDTEIPRENNATLKGVRQDINTVTYTQGLTETEHVYRTDAEIAETKRQAIADGQDLDNNRLESNEVLKSAQKELADAQLQAYNGQVEKYVANKAIIVDQVRQNGQIQEAEKEAHDQKVAYVDAMDKKAYIGAQEGLEGDEQERLAARKNIEGISGNVSNYSQERNDEIKENGVSMSDLNRTINAGIYDAGLNQTEKHYEVQGELNKVSNEPLPKPIIANSLGEEYPEGVSEESFTKSDQNGLMVAIVTRRIVVIEGHADVYIRTQTSNGITYTKNGVPIVAHVWSKETQDPKLERHY
jgi:tetratricopeptide (TPR) repeat protein